MELGCCCYIPFSFVIIISLCIRNNKNNNIGKIVFLLRITPCCLLVLFMLHLQYVFTVILPKCGVYGSLFSTKVLFYVQIIPIRVKQVEYEITTNVFPSIMRIYEEKYMRIYLYKYTHTWRKRCQTLLHLYYSEQIPFWNENIILLERRDNQQFISTCEGWEVKLIA